MPPLHPSVSISTIIISLLPLLYPRTQANPLPTPSPPPTAQCFRHTAHVFPDHCLLIIRSLPDNPQSSEPLPWGAPGAATNLPRTITILPGCELLLRKTVAWIDPPPEFALDWYISSLMDVYDECVVAGTRKGGHIAVGPQGGVDAALWVPPFAAAAEGNGNGNATVGWGGPTVVGNVTALGGSGAVQVA